MTAAAPRATGAQLDHLRAAASGDLFVNGRPGEVFTRPVRIGGKVNRAVVERLVGAGLVEPTALPSSAACRRYDLTPAGREVLAAVCDSVGQVPTMADSRPPRSGTGVCHAPTLTAARPVVPTAAPTVPAPAVLLVDTRGVPAVLASSGSLLLIDPDQPLRDAVRAVLALVPAVGPDEVRSWIAAGRFPNDDAGASRRHSRSAA